MRRGAQVHAVVALPIDFRDVESLEILISSDGKRVWVNSEEGCLLRAYGVKTLVVHDDRKKASG